VAGDAALLVDPLNTEQLTSALQQVATNERLRDELAEKGFRQVQKFSWRRSAEETLRVLEDATCIQKDVGHGLT
jgi:glycosyltransferase involved in cell wall biosynthesis